MKAQGAARSKIAGIQKWNPWLFLKAMRSGKLAIAIAMVSASLLSLSCFEDLDDNNREATTLEINDFIWRGLNYFYLYKGSVPQLQDNAFASNADKNAYLSSFDTPEDCFEALTDLSDPFSLLVDDYITLENALAGISLNNGMEYGLVYYPNDNSLIFGYVRYVIPGSYAGIQNIERGMIFNRVDGMQLTPSNYSDLLSPDTYTLGWATYDGTQITELNETTTLTKTQLSENPVHKTAVFSENGHTIAYLMYNGFTNEYDNDLNAAFGQFAAQGVTDMVLDLRYNGGGSVRTATSLASMITGQFQGEIFFTEQWNADRQAQYAEPGYFVNTLGNGAGLNSLGLSRVYVLTSGRTASASELVINGLKPYIDVIQIGLPTRGKYQASFLLYDAPAPAFSRNQANTGHSYAMLPLVFKTLNAAGVTDYADGLVPNIELAEDYSNLGILGHQNEPLLARAISEILGHPVPFDQGSTRSIQQQELQINRNALDGTMYR